MVPKFNYHLRCKSNGKWKTFYYDAKQLMQICCWKQSCLFYTHRYSTWPMGSLLQQDRNSPLITTENSHYFPLKKINKKVDLIIAEHCPPPGDNMTITTDQLLCLYCQKQLKWITVWYWLNEYLPWHSLAAKAGF